MILTRGGMRRRRNLAYRLVVGIAFVSSLGSVVWGANRDREGARRAWEEASRLRESLDTTPGPSREDYLKCIRTYQQVYMKDPHFGFSDDAVYEAAHLYQEMGERFGDLGYYRNAAKLYRFLTTDYQTSSRCPAALFNLVAISNGALRDMQGAQDASQKLLTRYRKSAEAVSLAKLEMALPAEPAQKANPSGSDPARTPAVALSIPAREEGGLSLVKDVRFWSNKEHTRLSIVTDGAVRYGKSRLENPARVFFDITDAKADRELLNKTITINDEFVKQVRVGQNRPAVVRIVIDLNENSSPSVSDLNEAFGIAIDIRSTAKAEAQSTQLQRSPEPRLSSGPPAVPKADLPKEIPPAVEKSALAKKPEKDPQNEALPATKEPSVSSGLPAGKDVAKTSIVPVPVLPQPLPPPKAALPTGRGDRTMTRMLGLKIGRIVIDPGHGGHDTGTIGPGGLMEKDLVLSLAKDLQKLLEEKLGAEVVLTRNDDTFISLEERTAIANQHQADLFLSLHANSSPLRNTSGVETYFLDFARTDSAREVAARENATSGHNIRDLQSLIEKIAQADKLEESREFASAIQKNLYRGVKKIMPSSRNRGVRSAPFVVLIGARMPSVLAEIGFISNPRDEKLLMKTPSRHSLAAALFQGIEGYMKSLGKAIAQNPGSPN